MFALPTLGANDFGGGLRSAAAPHDTPPSPGAVAPATTAPGAGPLAPCRPAGHPLSGCGTVRGPLTASPAPTPWTNATSSIPGGPQAMTYESMAYDPALGAVVMFGGSGQHADSPGGALNATWTFKAGTWAAQSPATSPPARRGAGMAYDAADGYLLLFGGYNTTTSQGVNDTWGYRNGTWFNLTASSENATNTPHFRWFPGMAYDALDGYVLLFGGCDLVGCYGQLGDTWAFRGGNWTNLTANLTVSPPARNSPVMSWDPAANRVLLYGGSGANVAANATFTYDQFNDTWEYANQTWTLLSTPVNPGHSSDGYLAYDAAGAYELYFGGLVDGPAGFAAEVSSQTWIFQGGSWRNETANVSLVPPGREGVENAGAYDAADGYAVMFGGISSNGTFLNDTWEFSWPLQANLSVSRPTVDANQSERFSVGEAGGSFEYSYWYRGLPAACPSVNASELTCAFPAPGDYTVNVTVNDTTGYQVVASLSLVVAPDPTMVVAVTPSAIDLGSSVTYTVTEAGGTLPLQYTYVSLPRGCRTGDTAVLSCTPTATGTYATIVALSDAVGYLVNSSAINLTVNEGPAVAVQPTVTGGIVPLTVTFNASVRNGTSPFTYIWSFGDGSAAAVGPSVVHTFTSTGNFTVTVRANDSDGRTSTSSLSISAFDPLAASTSTSPQVGVGPLAVTFGVDATGGSGGYVYAWNFGDGSSTGSFATVEHTYSHLGFYNATVNVTDSEGNRVVRDFSTVHVLAALLAAPVASRVLGEVPLSVGFNVSMTGGEPPYRYLWTFGDGGTSNASAPTHEYVVARSYTPELEVSDQLGELVKTTVQVDVYPALSVTLISSPEPAPVGANVTLNASVSGGYGAKTYRWSGLPPGCAPSDAATLTCQPSAIGSYSVALNVTDALGYSVSSAVSMTVSNAPASSTGPPPASLALELGLALVVVAVAVVGVVSLLRRRGRSPPPEDSAPEPTSEELEFDPPAT